MRSFALLLCLLTGPALAQDRDGNDTPSDWVVTHQKAFGLWDSVCDERAEDGALHQRCYIRYVDVFSPRPAFAAHFVFVTPDAGGVRIEYGSEPGTRFTRGGNRIEQGGAPIWSTDAADCLSGGACVFTGDAAAELYAALRGGGAWRFDFADRHGRLQTLAWDLSPFAAAADDYETEAAARGLH